MRRRDLRDAVKGVRPPVRLLALNWSLDLPHTEIHRICADRILARGANHQSLHGDEHGKVHESVLWRFLHATEPLTDEEADTVIEMTGGRISSTRFRTQSTRACAFLGYLAQMLSVSAQLSPGHAGIALHSRTRSCISNSGNHPHFRDTSACLQRSTSSTRSTHT